MLNPEDRYYIWQEYKERASKFFMDVDDDLRDKFAPYKQTEADKDAPAARRLFEMLEEVGAFISRHVDELEVEYSDWEDSQIKLQRSFGAWYYGLCPAVMVKANEWGGDFGRIAKFKQEDGISREDTEQAISLWRMTRKLSAASAPN